MTDFLEKIAQKTRARVAFEREKTPENVLENMPSFSRERLHIESVFEKKETNIIAEIKFASPSKGMICPFSDPVEIARDYVKSGARMLSILTEPEFFKGDLAYLKAVREAFDGFPLLRKDFIVDPYQVTQAKAFGADCVLVIVALNPPDVTRALLSRARALGLEALVEVHSEDEMAKALDLGASFIGVNTRNLKTLEIDLSVARRMARFKGEGLTLICESGLKDARTVSEMRGLGYDGFLIGSHFMADSSPGHALFTLLKGC